MAASGIKPGVPVMLRELEPSSPFFKHGQSLRVTGRIEAYRAETAVAEISDGDARLKIDTRRISGLVFCPRSLYQFIGELFFGSTSNDIDTRRISGLVFCPGSLYQFIGELFFGSTSNDVLLQARVGRVVNGLDLDLYQQSLQLSRKLESYIYIKFKCKKILKN